MTETLKDLFARLASRKFLLAVGATITLIAQRQYPEAMAVILGYLGVEGAADALTRRQEAPAETPAE